MIEFNLNWVVVQFEILTTANPPATSASPFNQNSVPRNQRVVRSSFNVREPCSGKLK